MTELILKISMVYLFSEIEKEDPREKKKCFSFRAGIRGRSTSAIAGAQADASEGLFVGPASEAVLYFFNSKKARKEKTALLACAVTIKAVEVSVAAARFFSFLPITLEGLSGEMFASSCSIWPEPLVLVKKRP